MFGFFVRELAANKTGTGDRIPVMRHVISEMKKCRQTAADAGSLEIVVEVVPKPCMLYR